MNVENFMRQLSAQTAPVASKGTFKPRERVLEKISLNFEGNFGMYQVLPVNSTIIDYPFIKLFGTREILVPRKNVAQDGTESIYNAWIKLLPKDAYQFLDLDGRVTSSLTAEEDQLLTEAYTVFDQLYNEIDARNNIQLSKDLLRKRNYTIFNAFCCNYWGYDTTGKIDIRNPKRSKFSGLFVSTAKGFVNSVEENIQTTSIEAGGGLQWLDEIYGRKASGRTGYMNFTIGRNTAVGMGYSVSVTHKFNVGNVVGSYTIDQESMDLMKSPVAAFLGWQASREDENTPIERRRIFNSSLIKEAILYMTKQLAAVRLAKDNNTSLEDAIKATSESVAIENNSSYIPKSTTNDPMLKQDTPAQQPVGLSPEEMQARNTDPYSTPASAKIDPITGQPQMPTGNNNPGFGGGFSGGFGQGNTSGSAPFSQPNFAKFGSNPTTSDNGEGDLPF
jgi:hypothetical protein